MKTKTLLLVAAALIVATIFIGTGTLPAAVSNSEMKATLRQYWQDELIQVSHAWRTQYAHQDPNEVQLAYQSVKVIKALNAQANAIAVLREQILLLSKNGDALREQLEAHIAEPATIDGEFDPNEVKK